MAIPSAMQADVIDYDELLTGERRRAGISGFGPYPRNWRLPSGSERPSRSSGRRGYEPNTEQTEQVRFTLRILYALIPCICNILAFVIALAYPINRMRHKRF